VDRTLGFCFSVVLAATLTAAVTDLRSFKISNVLTLPLLLSGLVYHGVAGGVEGFWGSALGALFGFGALFLFYLLGGIGGGDVKLMAGVGAWLGMPVVVLVFVVASMTAGIYAVVLIVVTGRVRETWTNLKVLWLRLAAVGRHLGADDRIEAEVERSDRRRRLVPFAAMVAAGIVALLVCVWLRNAA